MNIPQWADPELSAQLPQWIEEGESKSMEFKSQIPEKVHKLAQEIAAFATSGGGRLLLGVSDEGEVEGLPLSSGGDRDDYMERIQGVIEIVKPSVDAKPQFAVTGGKTIVVITVGKQSLPVFYVAHQPYIRDERRSRPARPEEVVECVWAHPSSQHKRDIERHQLEEEIKFADELRQIRSGRTR